MEKKKKPKKWMKFRHRVVRNLAYVVMYPLARIKYGLRVDKFKEQEKRPYLILLNHTTPWDQFFVGMSFKGPIYYMATEDIFSMGWVSGLIRWVVAPIPIKKQTVDLNAVMTCMRLAREGGTIAIAPEGNRSYSGTTEYMNPAIAGMARKLKMPIVLYRIEGGYGSQPRWSDGIRKGKMHSYVSRVIQPEEYNEMTNDELYEAIKTGLYVDEAVAEGPFRSKKKAEYLERAVYVCPKCGLSEFESHGDQAHCKKCGITVRYGEDKTITGVDCQFPFRFVKQWYDYQKDYVNRLDVMQYLEKPMYTDRADWSEVIVYSHKESRRKDVEMKLYGDRVVLEEGTDRQLVMSYEKVNAMSVLGRNKLNIYFEKHVYQFKGSPRFNALKYVNLYHRYRNIAKGDETAQFLGL